MLRIYRYCFLALLVLGANPAFAQSAVEWSVQLQGETLNIDAKTNAAQPAQRASASPAFLELSFPKARMAGSGISKAIDKGLIQKVQTSQDGDTVWVRVYVLTKPKATLSKTATGYRYSIRLNDPAAAAAAKTQGKPQGKPVANSKPGKPSAPSQPRSNPEPPAQPPAQPPAPPEASTLPAAGQGPSPQTHVSFVFNDKPLAEAIGEMANQAGFTAQIDPKLSGVVNLSLSDVPFDEALLMLLQPYGDSVTSSIGYTTVTVAKTSRASDPPAASLQSSGPEVLEYYPFQTKDAQKMMAALQKAVPDVSYRVDPLLNILLVKGPRDQVVKVGEMMKDMSKK